MYIQSQQKLLGKEQQLGVISSVGSHRVRQEWFSSHLYWRVCSIQEKNKRNGSKSDTLQFGNDLEILLGKPKFRGIIQVLVVTMKLRETETQGRGTNTGETVLNEAQ